MHKLVEKVQQYIRQQQLLQKDHRVLLGVSGGADSVTLLLLMLELVDTLDLQLAVGHLNHGIRAEQGRADATFVAGLAQKHHLPLFSESVNVPMLAQERKLSLETAGRSARYEFLSRTAIEHKYPLLALGHHADDQVETVLHRIIRGTGLEGLVGMAPSRLLSQEPRIRLIRPLLCCRRHELEEYLTEKSVQWCVDHTNLQTDVTRNWLRHKLLGMLRERLNPQVDQAILRLAEICGLAAEFLSQQAVELLEKMAECYGKIICIDLAQLVQAHPALRSQVVRLSWGILGLPERNMAAQTTREILSRGIRHMESGRLDRLSLPGGAQAECQFGKLILWDKAAEPASFQAARVPVNGSGCVGTLGLTVHCRLLPKGSDFSAMLHPQNRNRELIDRKSIKDPLLLRPAVDGEHFKPLGSRSEKTMKEFLLACRIPRLLHPVTPVLADEEGPLWVVGHRLAHRAGISKDTIEAVELSCNRQVAPRFYEENPEAEG